MFKFDFTSKTCMVLFLNTSLFKGNKGWTEVGFWKPKPRAYIKLVITPLWREIGLLQIKISPSTSYIKIDCNLL